MDSFYGAPRQPPQAPTIRAIGRAPTVPEVSVIENAFMPRVNMGMRPPSFPNNMKHVRFKGPHSEPLFGKENVPQTLKAVPDLKGKTFKQIYMANVPDRHLDLSIFEPPRVETPPRLQSIENNPCSSTVGVETALRLASPKYRDSSPVVFRSSPPRAPPKPLCTEICTQTEPTNTEIAPASDEPTIKDLFRIIQQQNEQIMLLQRQVNNLKTSIRQPEIDSAPHEDSPKKGLFSFDLKATSFEFSFRPPQKFRKNEFLEPRIQEIVECDSNLNNSLHLEESLEVKNSYVSNAPSIAIEMENYRSSDEEDPEVGVTFYKDLMKQVNKALKKAQRQSECQPPKDAKGQAMKAVKQATLQHLRDIGVNLAPIQESSEVTKGSDLESEVSCAVQQLLMKYLPSDRLAKVVNKPAKAPPPGQLAPQGGEFSFATLQYMKKYNLIDKSQGREERPPQAAPRILDVTALKLQPKLL